jgi:hypothetical protein
MKQVTIYTSNGSIMGNINKREGKLDSFRFGKYAQYPNALFVRYIPKRRRSVYEMTVTPISSSMDVLILEGWGHPNPDGIWDKSTSRSGVAGVTVTEGRYSCFDSGWQKDFDSMIDKYISENNVNILLDVRGSEKYFEEIRRYRKNELEKA